MTEINLPGFDLVELLGSGSGGEVWLARDGATGERVVLKRVHADDDLAGRDRVRREAAALAGIEHPHVVRLRGVHGDGDALVLVFDFAPGGSLARLLADRRRLAPGEVVTLAVPLAQALAAVHARGIVHGAVTAASVLFSADGRPLLGELGLATFLGSSAGDAGGGSVVGSSDLVDTALAAGGPTPAGDVHDLAATCWAALTGFPPYDEQGNRTPVPPGTHPGLAGVLDQALTAHPAERPTAEELAIAIFNACPAAPVRLGNVLGAAPGPVVLQSGAKLSSRSGPDGTAPLGDGRRHRAAPAPGRARSPAAKSAVRAPRRRHRATSAGGRVGTPTAMARVRAALAGRVRLVLALAAGGLGFGLAAITGIAWAGADDGPRAGGVESSRHARVTRAQPSRSERPEPPTASVKSVATPPVERWASTLARLDEVRSGAFAAGDLDALRSIYATGAPALHRDLAVLRRLTDEGLRATGLRLRPLTMAVDTHRDDRVVLTVTDVMSPYRLVDAAGTVVAARPGRGTRHWRVILTRAGTEWRVYDVRRAAAG